MPFTVIANLNRCYRCYCPRQVQHDTYMIHQLVIDVAAAATGQNITSPNHCATGPSTPNAAKDAYSDTALSNAGPRTVRFVIFAGTFMQTFLIVMVFLQGQPWIIVALFRDRSAPTGINPDGSRNIRNTLIWQVTSFGGAVNAVWISYVIYLSHSSDMRLLPMLSAYVTWWTSVWVIELALELYQHRKRDANGRPAAKQAENEFWGAILLVFGVDASEYDSENKLWLIDLVGVLPSVVVGFMFYWFFSPSTYVVCSRTSIQSSASDAVCTGDFCCYNRLGGTGFFPFVAYLTGNVLAAYGVVQTVAKVILNSQTMKGYGKVKA